MDPIKEYVEISQFKKQNGSKSVDRAGKHESFQNKLT